MKNTGKNKGHKGRGARGDGGRRGDSRPGGKGGKPHGPRNDRGHQDRPPHDRSRQDRTRTDRGGAESDAPRGRASIWGTHAVVAAWHNPARRIRGLFMTAEAQAALAPELADGPADRPPPQIVERRILDRLTAPGAVHQGVALDAAPLEEVYLQDLINAAAGRTRSVIVMLDQVTDPHNVGAIMRSACAFGAVGIVMQKRHAPELDGVLVKTASGAAEHMPVAYETNLSRALEELQEAGFFALALDERGDVSLEELPGYERAVIVMGAEGPGIRRLVKEHCDRLVRLPTGGPVGVLNVSNATAVALYALTTAP